MADDLIKTYNQIASQWREEALGKDWWQAAVNRFISILKPGGLVLDVGCGPGLKAKYLADHGLRVHGIDFSEKMIELARKEVPGAAFDVLDLRQVSTLPETYDGIFALASLLHIPKKEIPPVVAALISKLKLGGYVYLALKEKRPGQEEEKVITESIQGIKVSRFFSFFTFEEVKNLLLTHGLEIVFSEVLARKDVSWIEVIAKKP